MTPATKRHVDPSNGARGDIAEAESAVFGTRPSAPCPPHQGAPLGSRLQRLGHCASLCPTKTPRPPFSLFGFHFTLHSLPWSVKTLLLKHMWRPPPVVTASLGLLIPLVRVLETMRAGQADDGRIVYGSLGIPRSGIRCTVRCPQPSGRGGL
ncbi:MAG: hypothetical protein RI897_2625 [Verrucomicrobiota bacterium]